MDGQNELFQYGDGAPETTKKTTSYIQVDDPIDEGAEIEHQKKVAEMEAA